MRIPFIKNFRATTISRAFLIQAISLAIIAALTIEIRMYIKSHDQKSGFFVGFSETQKTIIVTIASFTIGILVYLLLYIFIGFGGGMIAPKKPVEF